MLKKARAANDAYAFSRGGLTVIASFVATPVIAGDRINQARDERICRARADCNDGTWNSRDCGAGSSGLPQAA